MTPQAFALTLSQYAVIGTVISLVISYTKNWISTKVNRMFYGIVLSIAGGVVIYYIGFIPEQWFTIIAGVVGSVNTMYLILVDKLPIGTAATQ